MVCIYIIYRHYKFSGVHAEGSFDIKKKRRRKKEEEEEGEKIVS